MVSADVFAHSNPAFCSLILYEFAKGYAEACDRATSLPLAFLPIPVILSEDVARSFDGTNVKTGLLEWIARHPEMHGILAECVSDARGISRSAILFGLQQGALQLSADASLLPGKGALRRQPKDRVGEPVERRYFANALCFGKWCSRVGDSAKIYQVLGVRP